MPSIVKSGKSDSTLKKYDVYFSKFKTWCSKYNLDHLPASVTTISLYITFLIQSHVSTSVLNSAYYSIKWEHDMNLYEEIFRDKFLKLILDGGTRILAKPVNKKCPITVDILKEVVLKHGISNDLKDLRICCLMLIGFAGFLRFDELSHIQVKNISIFNTHVEIKIEKSKTDIYRQGNVVVISRTETQYCPVVMLERYLREAHLDLESDQFIFRAVTFFKSTNKTVLCKQNKPISYTRTREIVLEVLDQLGYDKKQFGLHSLRSGGATAAASNSVPDRLLKSHGRWRCEHQRMDIFKNPLKTNY